MKKFFIGCGVVGVILVLGVAALIFWGVKTGNIKTNFETSFKINKPTVSKNVTKNISKSKDMPLSVVTDTAKGELKDFTTLIDTFLAKIDNGDSTYIYNELLHPGFKNTYTEEDIKKMFSSFHTATGNIESYDLENADITIKTNGNEAKYSIKTVANYFNGDSTLEIEAVKYNNQLRIYSFNLKSIDKNKE